MIAPSRVVTKSRKAPLVTGRRGDKGRFVTLKSGRVIFIPTGKRTKWADVRDRILAAQEGKERLGLFSPLPETKMSEAFSLLQPQDKLNPSYSIGVAREALLNRASGLIDGMLEDPQTRERVVVAIQDLNTGDLSLSEEVVGGWGRTRVPGTPKGFRRVGMIHVHPPAHPLRPSEPDMWKLNPMLRHGGFFGIAGVEGGQRGVRAWEWYRRGGEFNLYASKFYLVE